MARRRFAMLAAAVLAAGGLLPAACSAPDSDEPPGPVPAAPAGVLRWETGVAALDALQERLRPTLAANRRDIDGLTGRVRGFGAGDRYPQLWLRDSATLVPIARYYVPGDVLSSWVEEHLAHQQPSGALFDWVAAGTPADFPWAPQARLVWQREALALSADKNTTETDQESSAVLAAARAYAALADPAWLRRDVAGEPLLARLDAALEYVRRERRDSRGLVVGALTADWGDVSPTYGDQRAIYLDEATPRVAPLYANALFVGAARALAGLYEAAGDPEGAARWRTHADDVEAALREHLWQPTEGRFRIHAELPNTPPHPDESDMLAFGGHAVAALHGLLSEAELERLLADAEARHRIHGVETLAGTLLPPYPEGFFQHPVLREPWTYQNGGQWDWFAGRFLLALFEHGQAEAARRHLEAIAARVERADGVYEWYTREGEGRGSAQYAGSAAALGRALVEGLFGVDLGADGLRLRVRLGARPGRIEAHEPATGRRIAYSYEPDLGNGRLRLSLNGDPRPRLLEILLPPGFESRAVLVGGREAAWSVHDVGRDRYLRLAQPIAAGEVSVVVAAGLEAAA